MMRFVGIKIYDPVFQVYYPGERYRSPGS
jgi:hypothetical protein